MACLSLSRPNMYLESHFKRGAPSPPAGSSRTAAFKVAVRCHSTAAVSFGGYLATTSPLFVLVANLLVDGVVGDVSVDGLKTPILEPLSPAKRLFFGVPSDVLVLLAEIDWNKRLSYIIVKKNKNRVQQFSTISRQLSGWVPLDEYGSSHECAVKTHALETHPPRERPSLNVVPPRPLYPNK